MNEIIQLYYERKNMKITEEYAERIKKAKYSDETIQKYIELEDKFKADMEKLFSEQDDFINPAIKRSEKPYHNEYVISASFQTNEMKALRDEMMDKVGELDDVFEQASAHIKVASNKAEAEEILKRYNIIDNDGKIAI